MRAAPPITGPARGFTLVEVMLALGILGLALVILVKSVAGNVTAAGESYYMGVATDLARLKMNELEEKLLDEGFQESEQEEDGDFSDEGFPGVKWKAVIQPAELPSFEKLAGLANAQPGEEGAGGGSGSGSGSGEEGGEGALDKFQSSALGQMIGAFGGGFGGMGGGGGSGAIDTQGEAQTSGFIQTYYALVQQVLKASIRKITLTISYDTGLRKEEFKVVLYVTDPAGMAKSMGAVGT